MHLANEAIAGRCGGIAAPEFGPINEAVKDVSGHESWSRLCLDDLDRLLSKAAASGLTIPEGVID